MQRQAVAYHTDQTSIEIADSAANINHYNQAFQGLALQQESRQHLIPMISHLLRFFGEAITG